MDLDDVTRRRALSGTAAAGWLGGAALLTWKSVTAAKAAPPDHHASGLRGFPATEITRFAYRGRRVTIGEDGDRLAVEIDGRSLDHHSACLLATGRYASMQFPYQDFPNAPSLVRALIDGDGVYFRL